MTLFASHIGVLTSNALSEFDVSENATTMYLRPFYFVFEEAQASVDGPTSPLSVVGMRTYTYKLPSNFDALLAHARTRPTIRAVVCLYHSLNDLQHNPTPFLDALSPTTESIGLVLAYEEVKGSEYRAVGVNVATLEPDGA